MESLQELEEQRAKLKKELAEAEASLPAHSIRPNQMQRVIEAEEALEAVEDKIAELEKQSS